ncbi:MAG: metallophosphoesterase [Hyphomicrobiales bacterium]|nr:metallophosphoesterase [Hyphomicrobiales bacterium]MCP5372688.1 metallophosphoesterase [Hyphomicrobiales bacterium]
MNDTDAKTVTGERLFTFAVIADTHMNQKEDYSSSPYPCNRLANARTRRVIAELNQARPEFVVHLGDMINPVPELPTYGEATANFHQLAKDLAAPLHVVAGNHDIGDKPVSWMPAGRVNDEHIALYEKHFGRHFYSFDHRDLHLVIINSPIINSGLAAEAAQRHWLEADLAAAAEAGKRTFWCIHYPPYVSNPDESSSYDNIDEPGRGWLLDLIDRFRPEGVFCGHVHNFWYDLRGDTEIYLLPSTAFVRHDYSEFYRIEPGPDNGRDDAAKLGYFLVHVHARGHVAENLRSYGRTLEPGETLPPPAPRLRPRHSKENRVANVGVDLRHPWAEEMEIAPSGALDEFERKRARNDYPLLALWETGLRRLRLPIQDLLDPRVRDRMAILRRLGHTFQVYAYGLPEGAARAAVIAHAHLIDALEVVIGWDGAGAALAGLAALKAAGGPRVYLSRVNRKDAAKVEGARYNHLISHGFVFAEEDEIAQALAAAPGAVDGLVFKVARDTAPAGAVAEGARLAARLGLTACLYLKSTSASPAEDFIDDAANAARMAEAVAAAAGTPAADGAVELILDTLADADRGYFVRTGLVDRRYNPRLASHVVGHLLAAFHARDWTVDGEAREVAGGRVLFLRDGDARAAVVTGAAEAAAVAAALAGEGRAPARWTDLGSGRIHGAEDLSGAGLPALLEFA